MTYISVDPLFFLVTLGMAAFGPPLAFILGWRLSQPRPWIFTGEIDSGE